MNVCMQGTRRTCFKALAQSCLLNILQLNSEYDKRRIQELLTDEVAVYV